MEAAPRRERAGAASSEAGIASGHGVRELMRAVLLDAVMCLRARAGPAKERERLARDARQWMVSTARTWPFSFESVCDELGISASYLRALLLDSGAPLVRAPRENGTVEDIMRRLSTLRMRGNRRTRVLAKREYPRRRKSRDL